jgi:hypothetical protein
MQCNATMRRNKADSDSESTAILTIFEEFPYDLWTRGAAMGPSDFRSGAISMQEWRRAECSSVTEAF